MAEQGTKPTVSKRKENEEIELLKQQVAALQIAMQQIPQVQTHISPFQPSINIRAPDPFDINNPKKFKSWMQQFTRYLNLSSITADAMKKTLFLYYFGEKADKILLQVKPISDTYSDLISAFEKYFEPKRNVTFERYNFNSRKQGLDETVDEFILALHQIAEHCDFGDLHESLIRDQLILGLKDEATSRKLQLRPSLTLEEAINISKQAELQVAQEKMFRQDPLLNRVQKFCTKTPTRGPRKEEGRSTKTWNQPKPFHASRKCFSCGLSAHPKEKCPAKTSICRKCQRRGHWAQVCKSKRINYVNEHADEKMEQNNYKNFDQGNEKFVGHIDQGNKQNPWTVFITIDQFPIKIKFVIDTGADVSCIPSTLVPKNLRPMIQPSSISLYGPNNDILKVEGTIIRRIKHNSKVYKKSKLYIIEGLQFPLLGRPEIESLNLISFVRNLNLKHNLNENIEKSFPDIFNEMGNFRGEIEIKLKQGFEPFVQSSPRIVPIPLLDKLERELNRLLQMKIIEKIDTPTEWCSPIVVIPKGNSVRICCDFTQLNKQVLRPHYPILSVETTLGKLKNAKIFSKIDLNLGFYQIKLSKSCQKLTTFITPFGRYYFKRLPFGISCAPEYFSCKIGQLIENIPNVVYHVDDLLIYGPDVEAHNKILFQVLDALHKEGVTINKEKCQFGVNKVSYLGHVISDKGISIDPKRIEAIKKFPKPTNKTEVQQFLGTVNFAARFISNRANLLEPITDLLKDSKMFVWGHSQDQAFEKVKNVVGNAPTLSFFDPNKKVIVAADSSSFGIGACLMNENSSGERFIVAYASRTLRDSEKRWSQIEKEALALAWACERFKQFIIGIQVYLESDHKPLLQIFKTKPLDDLTPRLMRLRIRMMRYNYDIKYVPGKLLVVPDALSRNPIPIDKDVDFDELVQETNYYVSSIISNLPIKDPYLIKIQENQENDHLCKMLKKYTLGGWPDKSQLSPELSPYFQYRNDFSVIDLLLVKNSRIVIPKNLQLEVLNFIHQGHQGITKCRERAKMSVWWYGLSSELENIVKFCPNCIENRSNPKESFIKEPLPNRPWQKIAIDLYKLKDWYIIITDYYSRFFEICKLKHNLSQKKIEKMLLDCFSRFGIPEIVRTDNGPQFRKEFKKFATKFNFKHITSSPLYSQSNGAIEAAVKVAKSLIKKNPDNLQMALLAYRTSQLENGFTPAELLFGRQIRSLLPILPSRLDKPVNRSLIAEKESKLKSKIAENYDKRHKAVKSLPEINVNDAVWVTDLRKYGIIKQIGPEPRSYQVEVDGCIFRRNRWFLIPAPYCRLEQGVGENFPTESIQLDEGYPKSEMPQSTDLIVKNLTPRKEVPCSQSVVAPGKIQSPRLSSHDQEEKTYEEKKTTISTPLKRPVRIKKLPSHFKDFEVS